MTIIVLCVIEGFCHGCYYVSRFLGCYPASFLVLNRRFRTTICPFFRVKNRAMNENTGSGVGFIETRSREVNDRPSYS